jgi:hypothetical protein
MSDPVSHGQMMNYLVRNSEDKKRMREYFETNQITTASNINRPREPKLTQIFQDFNERNPLADGGRIGFYKGMSANKAPKKIKLKEPATLTGKAGDRKLTKKQIDALDPNYLGDFTGGGLDRPKKVYKSGTPGSIIDDAIEVRNVIVNNKGNIFNLEELGEKTGMFTKGTRPDNRTVKAALKLAKDNFPEIANFKFVTDRYKIDGKQRQQLNMVVDTIKAYQNSTGGDKLANFLPENMKMFYKRVIEEGPKKLPADPGKGLYMKMYNFDSQQIKYISDRITDETGQKFTSKDYKNLLTDVKKYRANVRSNKAQFTRAIEMNADIKKLYDDKVIQNLIKGDLNNKTKKQILDRAVNLLGDDVSIASRRLFMMAQSIGGTRPIEGIAVDKNLGKKIIDTQRIIGKAGNGYAFSSLVYDHYGKVIDQALNSPKGKSFIGYYQQEIRKALDSGLVPDEIFSVTASGRRGLEPYAIFTQALNADVNSKIKGANLDSLLSKTHRDLQNIFKGRKYNQLNAKDKKAVNDLVEIFNNAKTDVLKDLKPSIRNTIQLPEFDLKNPPSKAIANYASFDKNLKSAFDKSFKNVGYSMKVTPDMLTQKQLLENLKTSKAGAESGFVDLDLFKDIGKGADRFLFRPLTAIEAPTLAIPQSAYAASKLASDVAKGQETDTSALDITLPTAVSSLAASKKFGLDLFADNAGKVKRFLRGPFTQSGVRALSRGSLFATPFIETAIQGYNARQALLKAREKYGTDDMVPTAVGMAPREYVRDLAIENQKFEGEGLTPFSAAGGGIAKLAGDRSGPPPEKGPMSQGLSGLLKRANKI